jgi:signal transduction histidine kinase
MPVYALRSMHYYTIESTEWEDLYWWLTSSSLGWLQVLVYFFAASLHGVRFRSAERFIVIATLVNSVASLLVQFTLLAATNISPLFYLVQLVISVIAIVMTTLGALRAKSGNAILLAVILWLFLLMGVHDWLLQNWRIDVENIFLMPYGALLVVAVSLLAILQRYLAAVNEADLLNASLEAKLRERSRELEESHRKLRVIEQEQAIAGERQRLMREMHDGLGSSLMSSLVMVEQGKLDSSQVATVLRESIDDLKLTIDSLEPMGDDLLTLLGTLRYRLGKRLEVSGIKLEWGVQETPPLLWLNPTSSLQILRILQESLTNTLKHARASEIRVETGASDQEIYIRLIDNGIGFDVAAQRALPSGRGLQNLERRAATIGGSVTIESRPGRTAVVLHLPIERRITPR